METNGNKMFVDEFKKKHIDKMLVDEFKKLLTDHCSHCETKQECGHVWVENGKMVYCVYLNKLLEGQK